MVREIQLTKGFITLVDDDMFDELSKYHWRYHQGYAVRSEYIGTDPITRKKKKRHISMHREITQCPKGMCVDHADLNRLNNQRKNLRICTHAQNNANRKKYKNTNFGYKGVFPVGKKWAAQLRFERKTIHLGYYFCPHEAAKAYNKAALEKHKDYASLNEIIA